jgi:hypothetical protein
MIYFTNDCSLQLRAAKGYVDVQNVLKGLQEGNKPS